MRDGFSEAACVAAGRTLLAEGRLDEAIAAFDAALRFGPRNAGAQYLRGEALFLQRRLDDALASHAAAGRLASDDPAARGAAMSGIVPGDFGWMSHMLRGDFARAWQLADADREQRQRAGITGAEWPRHMRPVWDGTPLDGKRVLVRCYHGLGDTVQFIRYVPLLARRTHSVHVEMQPELLGVLQQVPGIAQVFPLGAQDRSRADCGCEAEIDVTELPHAFRTTIDTIPATIPYLFAEPAGMAEAARRLAGASQRLRVGLAWAAGGWKPERSVALDCVRNLADIRGVVLVSLQRGPEHRSWRERPGALPMIQAFDSDDVADTAATIANLDLVITVDTMVAHLAGALGARVWLMLHFAADWRWLLDRDNSPWYPTMRLFRQQRAGDWEPVVAEIAAALHEISPRS